MAETNALRGVDSRRLRAPVVKYEQPRVEKGRRLADVTGQGAVVPSGAPVPPPVAG
jgi:hypothetical protein